MSSTTLRAKLPTPSRRRQRHLPWLDWMAVPTMALLVVVIGYPIVRALMLSVFDYSLITGDAGAAYVGTDNFSRIGHDPVFWESLKNTGIFSVASLVGGGLIGLALAFATENLQGPWRFLRAVLLTPWAVPVIVTAFLFQFLFLDRGGLVNDLLMQAGILHSPVAWLGSNQWALSVTTVANIWQTAPFFLLVFTAGLRSVPNEVVEAAHIDRASPWAMLWHVKLPFLAGPGVIAAVIMTIQNVNQFPLIWAMTQGGPGYSSTTLTIYLYRLVFVSYNLGYASAIGVLWLGVLMLGAGWFLRRRRGGSR